MSLGRVLVVDDTESIREALQEHLQALGYDVQSASGLQQALSMAAEQRPQLVLTDLMLGDGSGLDLIKSLKEAAPGPGPACLLLTGYGTLETAIEAIRCGADEYLLKPVELSELEAVVGDLMLRHRSGSSTEEQARAALEALRQVNTPLSLLRAYLEMLGEGRFGPLTETQEDKIRQARDWVRQIGSLLRGVGRVPSSSQPRVRVEAAELEALFHGLFESWCEDFERRGVQVAWSQPPSATALQADLAAVKRDAEAFLADSLARAGMGMTLRLEWAPGEGHLSAALRLEPAPTHSFAHVGGSVTSLALPLATLSFRLRHDR
jgi:ActR/RegA family two-component response regulator